MSEEDIRNALVKFDREDILYGNYEIDIDTPVEVFITIKQMSKFIKQKHEIERLHSIIKEVREYADKMLESYDSKGLLEILDKEK